MDNHKGKLSFLALGSNVGNRLKNLEGAIQRLHRHPAISVNNVSHIYETKPVGYANQQDFLNLVIAASTSLSPEHLLEVTRDVEKELGRVRTIVNGPRTLDIDILFVDDNIVETVELVIPHPRLWERGFVLIPLCDLVGDDTILPGTTLPLSDWLKKVKDKEGVVRCQHIIWDSESERFVNLKDLHSNN